MKKQLLQFLRWSERYTKTDMVYLATGGFWLLGSQAINFILSFLLLWVFANLVSREVYGEYRFLTTAVAIFALTSLNGAGVAITRATALGAAGTFFPLLRLRVQFGLIGACIAIFSAFYYAWQGNIHLTQLFVLIAVFVPFIDSYTSYSFYLNGLKDFKRMAIFHTLHRLAVIAILVVFILMTQSVFWILFTYLFTTTITLYIAQKFAVRFHPPNKTVDESATSYAKHLSLMGIIRAAALYLDKIVLWFFLGPIAVAQYVIAVALPQEIVNAFTQLSKLALPKLSSRSKTEMRQSFLRKIGMFFLAVVFVIGLYTLTAPLIFKTFLPQYFDSIMYSQIASLYLIAAPVSLLTQYFYAVQHTKALYVTNFADPVVLILLYIIFTPIFGIIGVLAAVITRTILLFIALLLFFIFDKPTEE